MDDNKFQMQPINNSSPGIKIRSYKKLRIFLAAISSVVIILSAAATVAYKVMLRPVDVNDISNQSLEIEAGMTPGMIADKLESQKLVRSAFVFRLYIKIHKQENSLKAGIYDIKRSLSTPEIARVLFDGKDQKTIEVTFLPGGTEAQAVDQLKKAGFNSAEINKALMAKYDSPLFAGRPDSASLEGYFYGETHHFRQGVTPDQVLSKFFEDFQQFIVKNDLESAYKKQGLNLYEGITLASIVEREASDGDERQIAQVFLKRLKEGMILGSDVTYQYIADKEGKKRDINLDSPYNTRRYPGLPPGPIATPGREALLAVANPAPGDYLYFVYGDNGKVYFSKTEDEHERFAQQHCKVLCQEM